MAPSPPLRFIAVVFFLLSSLVVPAYANPEVGKPAPDFVVKRLDGQMFKLGTQQGKVTIVNFWATWCPPCREEMPLLNVIYKRYHSRGLDVIGISVDRDTRRRQVGLIMKQYSYLAAMQNDASDDDFGWMSSVPDTYIFDKQGILQAKYEAEELPLDENKLAALIEPLLAK